MKSHPKWHRTRDLPEHERAPFMEFLAGQTRPWIEGEPESEQDGFYWCDYENWKRKPQDRFFD